MTTELDAVLPGSWRTSKPDRESQTYFKRDARMNILEQSQGRT